MQQHPTSGSYNVGDVTETGGAAVHLCTSRGVRTISLICSLLEPDLVLCIILKSEEVVVGRGNGDRGDFARQVLVWSWDKGRKDILHTVGTLAYKSWRRKLVAHANQLQEVA